MSNAHASALEISAKIIRDNLAEPAAAPTDRGTPARGRGKSKPKQRLRAEYARGFKASLAGMYVIARRGEQ
jgi:hypothetical protein